MLIKVVNFISKERNTNKFTITYNVIPINIQGQMTESHSNFFIKIQKIGLQFGVKVVITTDINFTAPCKS